MSIDTIKIISCKLVKTISFKLLDGRNPPLDAKDIVRFKELNNLIPEKFRIQKINKLITI